ncbi:murein hydrolase activator EnvC family protein [Paenibacillus senegalensis]|uniref:murein hydrolase activator EnvC family protein n=1 Tax=Paenibacillus senegalensis TaxID=1465766 RepID=UPI0002885FAC|nr:M23 family metallopeptidase [Paenibacillus senegalensis]
MKKLSLAFVTVITAVGLLIQPLATEARSISEINKKLEEIQQREKEAADNRKQAADQISQLREQKQQELITLQELYNQIDQQVAKLDQLNNEVHQVTENLHRTSEELDEAEIRVEERDAQLKSRVRAMYMNGTVSYLDVLFSATSFADFIERFDMLRTISSNDKRLLEANKQDRDLIAEKKVQIEEQLEHVSRLYAEAEEVRQQLLVKEEQKKVAIASLTHQEHQAEEFSEEQEQALVELAKEKSQLYEEKNRLIAEQQRAAAANRANQPVNVSYSGGQLEWPIPSGGIITSEFGYRIDPIRKVKKLHAGMDIAAPSGTTIAAAEDGIVLIASWVNGYGNTVVLDHGDGMWTWYGHIRNNGIVVSEGDFVTRGQKIAEVGTTGDSTGNHLHFEVRINEKPVNPRPYLF